MALFGSDAGEATMQMALANRRASNQFRKRGMGYLGEGFDAASGYLDQVPGLFQGIMERGTAGADMYADAMGLGGQEGRDRAYSAFQGQPGYQFQQDEAQKAGLRAASAGGMLASGNTMAALADRAQGIADTSYQQWLGNLSPFASMELAGATGMAGGLGGLADLNTGYARDRVGVDSSATQGVIGANNMWAAGKEAQEASKGSLLGGLGGLFSKGLGMAFGNYL